MPFSENEMSSDPYRPPARSSTVKLCWRKSARPRARLDTFGPYRLRNLQCSDRPAFAYIYPCMWPITGLQLGDNGHFFLSVNTRIAVVRLKSIARGLAASPPVSPL